MLLVTYLEWDAGFMIILSCCRCAACKKPSSKCREVGGSVPEEMPQTLLTSQKHGKIDQKQATDIIGPT